MAASPDWRCPKALREIFDEVDKNGDGNINKREFIIALRKSEASRPHVPACLLPRGARGVQLYILYILSPP